MFEWDLEDALEIKKIIIDINPDYKNDPRLEAIKAISLNSFAENILKLKRDEEALAQKEKTY